MDVVFACKSKNQNRFTIGNLEGFGRVFFDKGVKVTQDKELIKKLLNHPMKKRGEYSLVTNEELVAKYLEGKESDKLTTEILNNLTRQGVIELGSILNSESTEPTIIKQEIVGSPITNAVQSIIDFYTIKKTKQEALEVAEQETEIKVTPKKGRPKSK